MDIDFEELEKASLQHTIYDANPFDSNPLLYRGSLDARYNFRLAPRAPELPQPSCRIDQDQSGDFDPSAKRLPQVLPVKRKREPVPPQLDKNGEPVPSKPRQVTWQFGRFNGLSLPITLKLTSCRGRRLLARGIDNWPADDDPESSTHSSIFTSASAGTSNTSNENHADPYVFRQRDKAYYDDCDQPNVDNDLDLSKITLGHPAARGCIPCLKLRLPCPLLEEGAIYPCYHCRDGGCDCELVIQPARKRSCQGCRRRRLTCSYLDPKSDHSQPCRTCFAIDDKCIAGPSNGRTRTGPSLDQADPTTNSLKASPRIPLGRRFVNCTQCRQAKRWCSLRAGQEGPCNRCKASGISCTFESLHSSTLRQEEIQLEPIPQPQPPTTPFNNNNVHSPTFDPFAPEPIFPQSITKTITTRLAHPITFNYIPYSETDTPHCHWCENILHGLLGLGTRTVTVMSIATPSGTETSAGYTELDGGHTSHGHLPSRMCPSCTLDRFTIVACEGHQLSPLPSGTTCNDDDDNDDLIMSVLSGERDSKTVAWDWCSICPSAATYTCRRPSSIWLENSGEDLETLGCGLMLCGECAGLLGECGGDLDEVVGRKMREAVAGGEEGGELWVRADAEFLTRGGELVRRVPTLG
ncbi:MAG: hypothetical protein Q9182_002012 [Xanthomendoza sp. 2 TL-2023]